MPLSEERIQELVASIAAFDRQLGNLALIARLHAQFHRAQDKKVEEIWDWKNRINGAVSLVLKLQLVLLGAFFAGAGTVAWFFLNASTHHP